MKQYRPSVTINGKEIKGPRFDRKSDADAWREQRQREKRFMQEGLHMPVDDKTTLGGFFDSTWIVARARKYPASTVYSDRQRFDDYVRPALGAMKVAKINQLQVRNTLASVVDKFGRSIQTRNRVRALLSKIFNDAMNETPPLRADNPALNISFNDPRQGKAKPEFIKREQDITAFMRAAKELSSAHYAYAAIALMAGPRKSELIPLMWSDFDSEQSELNFNKRFMQASNQIVPGLKSGSDDSRIVPIPDALVKALERHRKSSDFQTEGDFILARPDGKNFGPRELHNLHLDICKLSEIDVTPHGLRHTFGREWARRGGNMKALQAILGHSNSAVTDLYSQLAGRGLNQMRNTVSFEVEDDE